MRARCVDADLILWEQVPVSDEQYYTVQGAYAGTSRQRGPPLDLVLIVLGFTPIPDKPGQYESPLFPKADMTVQPWHYQITGALGMLVKMLGEVPLEGAPEEHKNDPKVIAAADALRGIPLHGVIIADETGFGKTAL